MIDLELPEKNIPAHLDVEEYIKKKKDGQVTFTLRINNGVVVDFNRVEYVNAKKYFGDKPYAEFRLSVKRNAETKPPVSFGNGERD